MKKVVLITGASRGLGRAIALRFASAGYRVVVNYLRHREAAFSVVKEIEQGGGEALPVCSDVRSSSEVQSMVSMVCEKWGYIDVLINNAAIARDNIILRVTLEEWEETMSTNLTGAFNTIKGVAGRMIEERNGHIINIASWSGKSGKAGQSAYSASKSALIGLTKSAAAEFGDSNIQVNAVLPGFMNTDMVHHISNTIRNTIISSNVMKREQDIHEVADFIFGLTIMNNISGQVFNLDSRIS